MGLFQRVFKKKAKTEETSQQSNLTQKEYFYVPIDDITSTPSSSPDQPQQITIKPTAKVYTRSSSGGFTQSGTAQGLEPQAEEINIQSQDKGNTLQPGQSSINAATYNGQTPGDRYERSLGSALGETGRNIFNFGVIGQESLSSYLNQAFLEPYEYVGKPKAYNFMPNPNLENWQGTEFGYGLSEDKKNIYRPDQYKKITYYEYGEQNKAALFKEAGLNYSGEPVSLIPQRVYEDVAGNLRPSFQNAADSGVDINIVNQQYNTAIETEYNKRIGGIPDFNKKVTSINRYQAEITTPPAYPIIKTTGRVIEAGALVGATAFGGSGITLAASTYMGLQTAKGAVNYAGDFKQLSTGQKILGGAGLAVGAAASLYTFNLGMTKYYSEWRGIIYNDLSNAPAKVTGREVFKNEELTRYQIASYRKAGDASALTLQRTDVYNTGVNRVGTFSKGVTRTKIWDPQYNKWITQDTAFKASGYVPSIDEGITLKRGAVDISRQDFSSGLGKNIYSDKNIIKGYDYTASAQDAGTYYNILGGKNPARAFVSYNKGIKTYTTRSTPDNAGRIFKLNNEGPSNLIITPGKKSSQGFYNQLYSTGSGASLQTTAQNQIFGIGSITTAQTKISSTTLPAITSQTSLTQTQSTQYSFMPSYVELMPSQVSENKSIISTNTEIISTGNRGGTGFSSLSLGETSLNKEIQGTGIAQIITPRLTQRSTSGFIIPGITAGAFAGIGYGGEPPIKPFFIPEISPYFEGLGSQTITGGQRKTGYTPSFSALIFNIKGSSKGGGALGISGLNFRPIKPGFEFSTGLGSAFKGFKRLIKKK